ncbi:MAG TPA: PEP-CTERM sorting domain-containing protein [Chthoniobacterales bacterium]|jgi:hypothetical protein
MKIPSRILALALAATSVVHLNAQSITDATPETQTQQQVSPLDPAELTASPWDFTGQPTLASIGFISITLTLIDGDSASGQFDFNHLFLALDGVNTGLALNGFRSGFQDTLTISGNISMSVSTMLLAQFADRQFVGTIVSDNQASIAMPNDIFVGAMPPAMASTTLTLAVPEPGTWALLGVGLTFVGLRLRRKQ